MRLVKVLLFLTLGGCCLPIAGPCGKDRVVLDNVDSRDAVIIESTDVVVGKSRPGFNRTHIVDIYPKNSSPVRMKAPVNKVHASEGITRFTAFSYINGKATPVVPVNCYSPLSKGHYLLSSVSRQDSQGTMRFYIVIQDKASKEVLCISSPGNTPVPVPPWVKEMLRNN